MLEETSDRQQRVENFLHAVEAAQKLQDDIIKHGLDAAYLYYEDVDGKWLEDWDINQEETVLESILRFLESDDLIAIRLRDKIERVNLENINKSILLSEIAVELEKSLAATEAEKLFAVKDMLIALFSDRENNQDISIENIHLQNNRIDLFDLAKALIEKLEEIVNQS
ncbi:MAG: hypothetical protein HC903_07605 [Methylacidiphilales bacterium]|nr:hypothetical protein [Candidatus Methylacidiphilales bacterium]NJR15067.1 hypothetical protein [Calothrix sp. CSU_2_0]